MYILAFFYDKADPRHIAATPDLTASVLPSGDWKEICRQQVLPEISGPDLTRIQAGVAENGYFIYPRRSARH